MDSPKTEKTTNLFDLPKAERDARLKQMMEEAGKEGASVIQILQHLSDIQDMIQGDLPPDAIL